MGAHARFNLATTQRELQSAQIALMETCRTAHRQGLVINTLCTAMEFKLVRAALWLVSRFVKPLRQLTPKALSGYMVPAASLFELRDMVVALDKQLAAEGVSASRRGHGEDSVKVVNGHAEIPGNLRTRIQ